jgi:hypothetical protein
MLPHSLDALFKTWQFYLGSLKQRSAITRTNKSTSRASVSTYPLLEISLSLIITRMFVYRAADPESQGRRHTIPQEPQRPPDRAILQVALLWASSNRAIDRDSPANTEELLPGVP